PLLNEAESLQQLYSEIVEYSPKDYEIIFINDGSDDNSEQVLEEIAFKDSSVKVVHFRKNFGKAAALNKGFGLAKGEIVFTLDADLQDNPVEIPKFINKIEEGYDLVSGWKENRKDPLTKRLPSKFFNWVTTSTFKLKLHDYNCGFKAYRKEVIKEISLYGELHRYIPVLAKAKGFRISEIPVLHRARQFGNSKYGVERYLRGFFDLLTVKLITQYNRSPLYLFGGVGSIMTSLGILINLYLSVLKFGYGYSLTNRPLLLFGTLLIIAGVQFFSIGLLGELMINQTKKHSSNDSISIKKITNLNES
ncbi:MAG: glycosyltransferase family 2 protein, partial [Candidatus Cloacimonadota bacterium]|nr:glycosyltransferase family 2 protein [Candidatus Cloacimonadota bacterium]